MVKKSTPNSIVNSSIKHKRVIAPALSRKEKILRYMKNHKKDFIFISLLMLISGIIHAVNMQGFPYYENDEATYLSRAWGFAYEGNMGPYTYNYDHFPAGWMFMALWIKLTGGLAIFDSLLESGRVFMLVLHVISTGLLYRLALKLSKNRTAAVIATLFFAFSPLAIYYQRRALLDNIIVFWLLIAFNLLFSKLKGIYAYMLASMILGIAVLSKVMAVMFAPYFFIAMFNKARKDNKVMLFTLSLMTFIFTSGFILIYALLKNEFFPVGLLPGDDTEHVSLITTLLDQGSRGTKTAFFNPTSDFYTSYVDWFNRDRVFITLATFSTVVGSFLAIFRRKYRYIFLLMLGYLAFLLRGSLVIEFYIVPLIPFMAILIGSVITEPLEYIKTKKVKFIYTALLALAFIGQYNLVNLPHFSKDETTNLQRATDYIYKNIGYGEDIIADNSIWPALEIESDYTNVDYFYVAEGDPEIKARLNNDVRSVDYLVLTNEIVQQINIGTIDFTKEVFDYSEPLVFFREGSSSYIDLNNYLSTNGDWVGIYKIKDYSGIVGLDNWKFIKQNFLESYGQIVDLNNDKQTTSDLQAKSMLRAVEESDKNVFDGIWLWTKNVFQFRQGDKLLSSTAEYDLESDSYIQTNSNSASSANVDIALALIQAYEKWGGSNYLDEARELLDDIWDIQVIDRGGLYYLRAEAAATTPTLTVNYSNFSPYHYSIFAEYSDKDWTGLREDTYRILENNSFSTGLLGSWYTVSSTGVIGSAAALVPGTTEFSYSGSELIWRLSLDHIYNSEQRATQLLSGIGNFYSAKYAESGQIFAGYDLSSGTASLNYSDLTVYSAAIMAVHATGDIELAKQIYLEQIVPLYDKETGAYTSGLVFDTQFLATQATYLLEVDVDKNTILDLEEDSVDE